MHADLVVQDSGDRPAVSCQTAVVEGAVERHAAAELGAARGFLRVPARSVLWLHVGDSDGNGGVVSCARDTTGRQLAGRW